AALIVLVAGVAWGLIRERDLIIGAWPPSARLYSMVGLGRTEPGFGLQLRNIAPTRGSDNGIPTLAIDGEAANTTTVARDVPKLRVPLRGNNDHGAQGWLIPVAPQGLLPGATVSFHTAVQQPAEGATGVVVSFAPPGE